MVWGDMVGCNVFNTRGDGAGVMCTFYLDRVLGGDGGIVVGGGRDVVRCGGGGISVDVA